MKNIIKGLLQTPALLVGIIVVLITLPLNTVLIYNAVIGNTAFTELVSYAYICILGIVFLPIAGVGMKREFERIFIRGER